LGVVLILLAFLGLRTYLIHRPLELPAYPTAAEWNGGDVFHILPTVNHERILVKASFKKPLSPPPRMRVDGRAVEGQKTDSDGRFWRFDAAGLEADRTYRLQFVDASGSPLCDSWPLRTFPAPDARPEKLRLLIFTGFGGHDAHIEWFGTGPLPLAVRHRLLQKALSLQPDALVSSGDQIYYDLMYDKSSRVMGAAPRSIAFAGRFDRDLPALGSPNEAVLKKAVGPQIAHLYGTACRSLPTFFLLDDHDYFENDIATREDGFDLKLLLLAWRSPFFKGGVSFPPDAFMLDLARSAHSLYLPEFLPDPNRPDDLPGASAPDRPPGVSECYGTLRYGKLLEALLYEGRRFTTLTGEDAVLTHPRAEEWLIRRMQAEDAVHVVNLPAAVFGWSAGKWMEWYPDLRGEDGKLTTAEAKYMWQPGWFDQHNRILQAASAMKRSLPLFICGDLHQQSAGKIARSGDLDMTPNPVISVCSGSLGTGRRGFPSSFRGMVAEPPVELEVRELLPSLEKNGFVIVDFTPAKVAIEFYAWKPPDSVEAIDTLQPHYRLEFKTPGNR
jgi:hypothetical protein